MKHACVTSKIGDDAKGGAGLIANKAKPADKVSADFRRNPPGWHEILLRTAVSTRKTPAEAGVVRLPCGAALRKINAFLEPYTHTVSQLRAGTGCR